MNWKPGNETLLVLKQIGYPVQLLEQSITEYQKGIAHYPNYCMKRDQDYVSFLRAKYFNQSFAIEAKYRTIAAWIPTKEEYDELESIGYWKEIIDNQLTLFIFDGIDILSAAKATEIPNSLQS